VTTVLALRALGLGDALTGIPALRGLRRAWPYAELALACPPPLGHWLRRLGVVDRVVACHGAHQPPWHGAPPDVAVNLHGRGPQSHRALLSLAPRRLVAFRDEETAFTDGPVWQADEHEVDRWTRLVRSVGGECSAQDLRLRPRRQASPGGPVVVHPGAASGSRRWPLDRWLAVVDQLVRRRPVVVTGTPSEGSLCAVLGAVPGVENRCGSDDLDSLTDLVASASLLLSGDTGVAHLATAVATPSVTLFGPVPPRWWGPLLDPDLHTVLWHADPAAPALGDPHATEVDPRLASVSVPEVLWAAERLLAGALPRVAGA